MANIRLSRTVYKKDELDKSIDSSFKSFVDTVEVDTDTVEEFFRLYTKLYYDIEPLGEFNSHEFLIKESSKLVQLETNDEAIQPLLDEISDLRQRLLEQNVENIENENDLMQSIGKSENIDLEEGLKSLQSKIELSKDEIQLNSAPKAQPTKPIEKIEDSTFIRPKPKGRVKQSWAAVRVKKADLERQGKTRNEIRDALYAFGASKGQIARVL